MALKLAPPPVVHIGRGGVIEAQHGTLRRMFCATIAETGCPLEDCLVGCIIATSTLGQVHGSTPEQHAFGKNRTNGVSFFPPSVVDYTSVPMEYQKSMTNRLHAMQVARDVYHKRHTKERLFRPMRLNTRVIPLKGEIGDKVWFWRDPKFKEDQTWRGPSVICGVHPVLYQMRIGGGGGGVTPAYTPCDALCAWS